MKPLLAKELPNFIKRFGNFVDAEIRSVEVISASTMLVTVACQDCARDFDWITITLELSGISDARLLEDSKLSLVDMSEGLSLIYEENSFAFGIGDYYNLSGIKNATSYIISSCVKYKEGSF